MGMLIFRCNQLISSRSSHALHDNRRSQVNRSSIVLVGRSSHTLLRPMKNIMACPKVILSSNNMVTLTYQTISTTVHVYNGKLQVEHCLLACGYIWPHALFHAPCLYCTGTDSPRAAAAMALVAPTMARSAVIACIIMV